MENREEIQLLRLQDKCKELRKENEKLKAKNINEILLTNLKNQINNMNNTIGYLQNKLNKSIVLNEELLNDKKINHHNYMLGNKMDTLKEIKEIQQYKDNIKTI